MGSFFYVFIDLMGRVDDDGWTTGYIGNEVVIDSIYDPYVIKQSDGWSDNLRGFTTYDNDMYFLEWQLILNKPGRYVHILLDVLLADSNSELPEYAAAKNDSGCPNPQYIVSYVLQGDPHFEEFETELVYIDDNVKRDNMCSFYGDPSDFWAGGSCRIRVEFSGVFGFEVVE